MIYHEWMTAGNHPSIRRHMFIKESHEHSPVFTHTAIGGKKIASTPRKISPQLMADRVKGTDLKTGSGWGLKKC